MTPRSSPTAPRIISASRRTDIPAFYGDWFRARLKAGFCEVRNPFNGMVSRVSLLPPDVLSYVFWSRNYAPFLSVLDGLKEGGVPFSCHYTITGMPRSIEARAPEAMEVVETARELSRRFGQETLLWRYDPVLLSSETPPEWHLENFTRLAEFLRGFSNRCYFSFPSMYRKTKRNLERRAREAGFRVWTESAGNFDESILRGLIEELASRAMARGFRMYSCCGDKWVNPSRNLFKASCVDWPPPQSTDATPADFAGPAVKPGPTRPECGCRQSVDIGAYHSCAHACAYCYAVDDPDKALEFHRAHDPNAAELTTVYGYTKSGTPRE
jgi:hypothetical protein